MKEAALALGRSESTFRRWLDTDRMPLPYLRDTTRGFTVYSVGEMEVIARILTQHAEEFRYFTGANEVVIQTLFQHVSAFRSQYI